MSSSSSTSTSDVKKSETIHPPSKKLEGLNSQAKWWIGVSVAAHLLLVMALHICGYSAFADLKPILISSSPTTMLHFLLFVYAYSFCMVVASMMGSM